MIFIVTISGLMNASKRMLSTNAIKNKICFITGKYLIPLTKQKKQLIIQPVEAFATDLHKAINGLNAWTSGEILASAV